MIPESEWLIEQFQKAYRDRKAAKAKYMETPTRDNADDYTAAVLAWDDAWQKIMEYKT